MVFLLEILVLFIIFFSSEFLAYFLIRKIDKNERKKLKKWENELYNLHEENE